MRIAVWRGRGPEMNQRERDELCDRVIEEFGLDSTATYKDACRRAGEVMSEHLGAGVEVRFVTMRNTRLSGATARRADGTYIIYCARSRSWYHRLGILLHELAHLLLGHQPVTLTASERTQHFAPHLPHKMVRLIAERTTHTRGEERQAEEFADRLLERLTEQRQETEAEALFTMKPHVLRIAEGLAPAPGYRRHRAGDTG